MKTSKRGFTLIELTVVIAIIIIIGLWMRGFSVNTVSDKQNLERTVALVVWKLETVRGDSLLGKWIGASLETPDNYIIQFSSVWWENMYFWYTLSWVPNVHPTISNIDFWTRRESLSKIECYPLNSPLPKLVSNSDAFLNFSGWKISLSWECDSNAVWWEKILRLTLTRGTFTRVITVNTVSWIISAD